MKKTNINNCRVCGYYLIDAPWGNDGKTPTYEICQCCGVEFGNEDYTLESVNNYRKKWLKRNMEWLQDNLKPKDWDFEKQLKNIPKGYKP